jgi:hypothetical protein
MNSQSSIGEFPNNSRQGTEQPSAVFAREAGGDERTFPGPWSVDQIPQGYRVFDANHRVLAYVVTGDQGTKDHSGGLTLEEARRIARVISSLPDLITDPLKGRTKRSLWKSMRGSN